MCAMSRSNYLIEGSVIPARIDLSVSKFSFVIKHVFADDNIYVSFEIIKSKIFVYRFTRKLPATGDYARYGAFHTGEVAYAYDNLDFVKPEALDQSYALIESILDLLDQNCTYERVDGRGEPQLGRRGLYRAIAGQREAGGATQMDLLWFLNLADGRHSLLDMAIRADVPFARLETAARLALESSLVREAIDPMI